MKVTKIQNRRIEAMRQNFNEHRPNYFSQMLAKEMVEGLIRKLRENPYMSMRIGVIYICPNHYHAIIKCESYEDYLFLSNHIEDIKTEARYLGFVFEKISIIFGLE